jgi:hypothetical protein
MRVKVIVPVPPHDIGSNARVATGPLRVPEKRHGRTFGNVVVWKKPFTDEPLTLAARKPRSKTRPWRVATVYVAGPLACSVTVMVVVITAGLVIVIGPRNT